MNPDKSNDEIETVLYQLLKDADEFTWETGLRRKFFAARDRVRKLLDAKDAEHKKALEEAELAIRRRNDRIIELESELAAAQAIINKGEDICNAAHQDLIHKYEQLKKELSAAQADMIKFRTSYEEECHKSLTLETQLSEAQRKGEDLCDFTGPKLIELGQLKSKLARYEEALKGVVDVALSPGMEDPFRNGWKWFYRCEDALKLTEGGAQ